MAPWLLVGGVGVGVYGAGVGLGVVPNVPNDTGDVRALVQHAIKGLLGRHTLRGAWLVVKEGFVHDPGLPQRASGGMVGCSASSSYCRSMGGNTACGSGQHGGAIMVVQQGGKAGGFPGLGEEVVVGEAKS